MRLMTLLPLHQRITAGRRMMTVVSGECDFCGRPFDDEHPVHYHYFPENKVFCTDACRIDYINMRDKHLQMVANAARLQ